MNVSEKLALAAASLFGLVVATPAQAVLVEFAVTGDTETVELSNGLDADVSLDGGNDSVDLTPGAAEVIFFAPGSVTLTQGSTATGSGTLTPGLAITGAGGSQSFSQSVTITQRPFSFPNNAEADVVIGGSSPLLFNIGSAYQLKVTPLGGSRIGQETSTIPFSTSAEFLLTSVPEPTSALVMAAGGALLLVHRRR